VSTHETRSLEELFATARSARSDVAVLEGFHAIKHALRFGAAPSIVVSSDVAAIDTLAAELAPDIRAELRALVVEISAEKLARIAPRPPGSPIVALAPRASADVATMLQRGTSHVVMLEDPRHAGNVGAVIRVAAAANAAGVITLGDLDVWSAPVIRGAAGLHYALSIASIGTVEEIPTPQRALIALDPEGDVLEAGAIPRDAVLMFGTERHGLSSALRQRADATFRLAMRPGVSSLNLATAVSASLYLLQATISETGQP
jgi:RNA methyltransferase, TrmH family